MTSRSYFDKMNSTLGSVVPLAMFNLFIVTHRSTSSELTLMEQTHKKYLHFLVEYNTI